MFHAHARAYACSLLPTSCPRGFYRIRHDPIRDRPRIRLPLTRSLPNEPDSWLMRLGTGTRWKLPLRTMKSRIIFLLQLALTLAVLAWIFSTPGVARSVAVAVRAADPVWMTLAIVCAGTSVFAQALRWHFLLKMQGLDLPYWKTCAINLIGEFFGSFFLGGLGGDAAKVLFVAREYPHRKAAALLSVVLDHMSGLLALIVAAGVFTVGRIERFQNSPIAETMLVAVGVYIGVCLLGIATCLFSARLGLPERLRLPARAKKRLLQVDEALAQATRQWKYSLAAVGVSFFMLLAYYLSFYCGSRAINAGVPIGDFLAVLPVVDVMSSFPVTIAGLGIREKSFELLLASIAGVPAATAVLISLTGFAASQFWSLVGGAVFLLFRSGSMTGPVACHAEKGGRATGRESSTC